MRISQLATLALFLPFAAVQFSTTGLHAQTTEEIALVDAPSTVRAQDAALLQSHAAPTPEDRKRDKEQSEIDRNTACEAGALHGKPCRVSWLRVLGSSFLFLASQHGGNIAEDSDTRYNLTHGTYGGFWADYVYCVDHYRWSRWKDDDPFGVDYIGHPIMGALTSSIYEQNDPKQRALTFENKQIYWMGRLRAMAYSAVYSAQWKVGPLSEASIGNTGIGYYIRDRDGVYTNETGMQDFFFTPIGGFAWNVGEDIMDRYVLGFIRHHTRNRVLLFSSGVLTPSRSAANLARFKSPYYRDWDARTENTYVR